MGELFYPSSIISTFEYCRSMHHNSALLSLDWLSLLIHRKISQFNIPYSAIWSHHYPRSWVNGVTLCPFSPPPRLGRRLLCNPGLPLSPSPPLLKSLEAWPLGLCWRRGVGVGPQPEDGLSSTGKWLFRLFFCFFFSLGVLWRGTHKLALGIGHAMPSGIGLCVLLVRLLTPQL